MTDVIAPENEEGTKATILRWCKAAGETIRKDEPLLELETDKNIKVVVGDVELQKLGVVPRTVFLKSRNAFDHTPRSSRLTTYSSRRSSGTDYLRSEERRVGKECVP